MGTTIAIIDDDHDDLALLKRAIHHYDTGFRLLDYDDPEYALENLLAEETLRPDYVFLDVNMPKITGGECLIALKRHPKFSGTKVIMISTFMPAESTQEFISKGAFCALQKPESWMKFKEVITELLDDPDQFLCQQSRP